MECLTCGAYLRPFEQKLRAHGHAGGQLLRADRLGRSLMPTRQNPRQAMRPVNTHRVEYQPVAPNGYQQMQQAGSAELFMRSARERNVGVRINGVTMPTEPPTVEHQWANNQIVLRILAQPVGKLHCSQ